MSMTYKGYSARIEYAADDELFVGHIAGITDIIGFHADTVAGLKAEFASAVDSYLDACAEIGKSPQKSYSGKLMLRINPGTHAKAVVAAKLAGKSLNEWGEEALNAAASER